MKNGKTNLLTLILKKSKNLLDKKKISLFTNINNKVFILFGLILVICILSDFYFTNSQLTIPFIITTLISSIITFASIPKLKKIKIKQFIREQGPKNHFLKQGTPTMGGIFFIPIGIIIGNILYLNKEDYKIILTLSFLIIFFMFIGFIDDFLSLKKQLNTGLKSNQKIILQLFISLIFIIICASNNLIPHNIQIANNIVPLEI